MGALPSLAVWCTANQWQFALQPRDCCVTTGMSPTSLRVSFVMRSIATGALTSWPEEKTRILAGPEICITSIFSNSILKMRELRLKEIKLLTQDHKWCQIQRWAPGFRDWAASALPGSLRRMNVLCGLKKGYTHVGCCYDDDNTAYYFVVNSKMLLCWYI